ncbi:MAG: DUF4342 domain-containing protein [Erysipelotrichaceae bacterium]|nr:DUF4342 domain-containing protein [Erysipelotrichaceae bacterium]
MSENKNPNADQIVEKIKEYVKKGNIARILLKHGDNTILNIPLNVGIIGTILGAAVAPWALIASAIATLGLDCKVELEKTDGEIIELFSREVGNTAVNVGKNLWNNVKDGVKKETSAPAEETVVDVPEEEVKDVTSEEKPQD